MMTEDIDFSRPHVLNMGSVGMNAVIEGNSEMLREPNPHGAPFCHAFMRRLFWRVTIFGDELALYLLQENINKFYE